MKRYVVIALVAVGISVSCNENKTSTAGAEKDTAVVFTPPVTKSDGSADGSITVTPFEMKDDSVFTDGSVPTSWENAGITDVKGFKLFLKQVQLWIMDNDKEKLASIVKYPLKNIKTPQELVENYDAVFTKHVKLSFATINFNQIFRNAQGAMTDGGAVWFAQQGKVFKIIAINY